MRRLRSLIFWLHLAAGVTAGLVVLVLALTGAALAFKPQILNAVDTAGYQVDARGRQRLSASALLAAVQDAQDGAVVRAITLPRDGSTPASAQMAGTTVYLDPYSGDVLGESSAQAQQWFRTIENWHRWLAFSGDSRQTGRAITGVANAIFLGLALTGLFLWWPRAWSRRHLAPIVWFQRTEIGRAHV